MLTTSRHPWLDALTADPAGQVRALVLGHPFGPAEAQDAAATMMFGLPASDPAHAALDRGCLAVLGDLARDLRGSNRIGRPALALHRLLGVVQRLRPAATARDLHGRYPFWFNTFETAILDRNLDLRREYWRTLALTQSFDTGGRRLLPLWQDICGEAGPAGRYDPSYLDVGELGIRKLPLGAEDSSNEEAMCHALARWAIRQRPAKAEFLARWDEIQEFYPRALDFWPPLVADVVAAVMAELKHSFAAARWWLEDVEEPEPDPRKRQAEVPWRSVRLPARTEHEGILDDIAQPLAALRPRIDALMTGHRRYADSTGDVYYLVRTACKVGSRLLDANPAERAERGRVAVDLAKIALDYDPTNHFAWALWRDALAAGGATLAAESVGWEAIRRFPENQQWPNQLATLLTDLGRPDEAARLLRWTMETFPTDPVCRCQLATLLADVFSKPDEAARLLRETIAASPDHPHAYTQLATLLAARLDDVAGALAVLEALFARDYGGGPARPLHEQLRAGRIPRGSKTHRAAPHVDTSGVGAPFATAWLRRGVFRVETAASAEERDAAMAELKTLLDADGGSAYGRYVAERVGLAASAPSPGGFAMAFDRAARARDAGAIEALAPQALGIDALTVRAALVVVHGRGDFPRPEAANDSDPGASAHRFAMLAGPVAAGPAALRLLSDFAASGLSLAPLSLAS